MPCAVMQSQMRVREREGGAKQLKLIKENARMTRATLTGKNNDSERKKNDNHSVHVLEKKGAAAVVISEPLLA